MAPAQDPPVADDSPRPDEAADLAQVRTYVFILVAIREIGIPFGFPCLAASGFPRHGLLTLFPSTMMDNR